MRGWVKCSTCHLFTTIYSLQEPVYCKKCKTPIPFTLSGITTEEPLWIKRSHCETHSLLERPKIIRFQ